jgi:hypothetical protein
MNNQIQDTSRLDASLLGTIANILLVVGVIAVYQGGIQAGYSLGLLALVAGVIATVVSLVWKSTHPLKMFEHIAVVGMFMGILGMLQPWDIKLYEYGFVVLGLCTLAFTVVIHIPVAETD